MLWDHVSPPEELAAAEDADELCRLLLAEPWAWGTSTSHSEAVELLRGVDGTSDLPASFIALMLCTCRRWNRVSARLIAAVQDSGLLNDADLDELSDWFLSHEHVIAYPLAWVTPQWLEVDLSDGTSRSYTVDEHTLGHHHPSFEPPLRRWAARRALHADPQRLEDLLISAGLFEPRHRDSLIHGLLDAADVLDAATRRRLIERGLQTAQAGVRRTALDRLCALDGPAQALRRARADSNAAVRKWRPQLPEATQLPSLWPVEE